MAAMSDSRPRGAPPAATPERVQPWVVGCALMFLLIGAGRLFSHYGLRHAMLLLVGAGLGIVLYHARFGFTSAFRALIVTGDGRGLRAQMVMLALATLLFAPILALSSPRRWGCRSAQSLGPGGRLYLRHWHATWGRLSVRHALPGRRRLNRHLTHARRFHCRHHTRHIPHAVLVVHALTRVRDAQSTARMDPCHRCAARPVCHHRIGHVRDRIPCPSTTCRRGVRRTALAPRLARPLAPPCGSGRARRAQCRHPSSSPDIPGASPGPFHCGEVKP